MVAQEVTADRVAGIQVSSTVVHPRHDPGRSQPALCGILIRAESDQLGARSPDPAAIP